MNEHERGFLAFLSEPDRRRMASLLALGERRRVQVRSLLHSKVRLDPSFAHLLSGEESFPQPVESLMKKHGAPAVCYVLGGGALDGRKMPLDEALDGLIGMGNGAFVSSIPGQLGFFQYAAMKSEYLLLNIR